MISAAQTVDAHLVELAIDEFRRALGGRGQLGGAG